MNKFKLNVLISLTMAGLCTTLLYQNCAKTKYSQANQNGISGGLGSLDDGILPVEVIVDNCSDPEDLEKPVCKEPITLNLYVEEGVNRTKIDSVQALPQIIEEDGNQVVKYIARFNINMTTYACKTLVVTHVSVIGEVDIGKVKVPGAGCEEIGDGTFKIDSITQDNRLFEAVGRCTGSAKVEFSGNISSNASNETSCTSSQFKFCSYTTKHGSNNVIGAKQGSKTDMKTIVGAGTASVFVTMDHASFNPATTPFYARGRCTPGADITLSIYGVKRPVIKCTSSGTWEHPSASILVTTLTDRRLDINASHSLGSMNMFTNIDLASAPGCTIDQKVPHATLCLKDKNAGSIKGACRTGLPIELKVNNVYIGTQVCIAGKYDFKNVLLGKPGQNNTVSVHQIQTGQNGNTAKCDKSVVMTSF